MYCDTDLAVGWLLFLEKVRLNTPVDGLPCSKLRGNAKVERTNSFKPNKHVKIKPLVSQCSIQIPKRLRELERRIKIWSFTTMHFHIYSTTNRITRFSHTVTLTQLYHQDIYSFDTLKRSVVSDK